eukprot:COSAG05_NODE_651_length_8095_cov_17.048572_6_plen_34_part_00
MHAPFAVDTRTNYFVASGRSVIINEASSQFYIY